MGQIKNNGRCCHVGNRNKKADFKEIRFLFITLKLLRSVRAHSQKLAQITPPAIDARRMAKYHRACSNRLRLVYQYAIRL